MHETNILKRIEMSQIQYISTFLDVQRGIKQLPSFLQDIINTVQIIQQINQQLDSNCKPWMKNQCTLYNVHCTVTIMVASSEFKM